nr:ATP-binding protein [Parvularcula mediterranea]
MIDSIEGLAQTLDDILTFSKSTTGGTFEEVRSDALVRRLRAHYGEDVLTIGHVDAATITGAPESILRALRNLIDNASRFAGRAELSVRHAPEGISFCIDDDGPGLADDDLVRMQEPFTRAEGSRNRQDGGAGLGLAIARGVAEAHQGRLVLTNRTSGGLSAQFILPSSGDS